MSEQNEQFRKVVSELANALQTALPLVDRVRIVAHQQVTDATDARVALDRAVSAVRRLAEGGK